MSRSSSYDVSNAPEDEERNPERTSSFDMGMTQVPETLIPGSDPFSGTYAYGGESQAGPSRPHQTVAESTFWDPERTPSVQPEDLPPETYMSPKQSEGRSKAIQPPTSTLHQIISQDSPSDDLTPEITRITSNTLEESASNIPHTSQEDAQEEPTSFIPSRGAPSSITAEQLDCIEESSRLAKDLYLGLESETRQMVTIKNLRLTSRIRKQAKGKSTVRRYEHPRLVPFIGWRHSQGVSLVTPRYRNGNLRDYLKAKPEAEVLPLMIQAADGLLYLHSLGVVHGGVKMENVLVTDDDTAVLTDIGVIPEIERVYQGDLAAGSMDDVRRLAPEYLRDGTLSVKSDVYSFACLILEVISGKPPFYALREPHVSLAIMQGKVPERRDYPEMFERYPELSWRFLERCWDGDPQQRPGMSPVKAELEHQ